MNKTPDPVSTVPATSANRRTKPAGERRPRSRSAATSTLGRKSSAEVNRRAAVILEVLAGERLPSAAAQVLGISITHYYLLERRALEGLLAACEARPKGRAAPTAERQVARLERELEASRRHCQRQAALVRATQRAVGLPVAAPAAADTKSASNAQRPTKGKRRRRRPTIRALRAAHALEKNSSLPPGTDGLQPLAAGESVESAGKPLEER